MRTRSRTRSTVGALALALSASAFCGRGSVVGQTSFSPDQPTTADTVTLTVRRTFEADCGWQVEPDVERRDGEIVVKLKLSGTQNCEGVITDLAFEVEIGRLPEGENEVKVCWSDRRTSETTRITVVPAIAETSPRPNGEGADIDANAVSESGKRARRVSECHDRGT